MRGRRALVALLVAAACAARADYLSPFYDSRPGMTVSQNGTITRTPGKGTTIRFATDTGDRELPARIPAGLMRKEYLDRPMRITAVIRDSGGRTLEVLAVEWVTEDQRIRFLATQYRDDWIKRHPSGESAVLSRGTIRSMTREKGLWHVVFLAQTGQGASEGSHGYFLHVYLKMSGELEKIVRGPDLLT